MFAKRLLIALVFLVAGCHATQTHFSIPVCNSDGTNCHCLLAGFVICNHACVNPSFDHGNCGACGVDCGNRLCNNGACASSCGSGMQCGNRCQYDSSPFDCGSCNQQCDVACESNLYCVDTVPPPAPDMACNSGFTACSSGCVNLATDTLNCGGCGISCDTDESCVANGTGGAFCCGNTMMVCSGRCIDTNDDANNCGFCGNQCGQSSFCEQGACQ